MINYISIRQIADNLMLHPLMLDITMERIVNYAVEFIRIVGMPKAFTDKVTTVNLINYRASLPDDFIEIIQVTDEKGHSYRNTTDTFHLDTLLKTSDLTYKILNNILFSNRENGNLKVSYRAIEADSKGFPLIADNSSFVKALELYIKKQWFTILFDLGKIQPVVLNNVLLEYAWYVGLALSDLVRPSIDEMVSITHMWNKLIPNVQEYNKQFVHLGTREYIKAH